MFMTLRTSRLVVTCAVAATLIVAPIAHAGNAVTSTAVLPFAGSFFDDTSSQMVNISGSVHVVSHVAFTSSATHLDVYADLPTAFGTGQTTGCKYILYGANQVDQAFVPGPISAATVIGAFSIPGNPIMPQNILCPTPLGARVFLRLNLRFAPEGRLLGSSVDGGSTVQVCGEESCGG